jgi:hypothetical protein
LSRTKQSRKSSYTIPEKSLDERHGKCVKAKINASLFKKNSFWMKIFNERGEVNLNQWMKMAKGHNGLS